MNQNSNSSPFAGIVLPEGANVSFNNISGDYIAGNVYHNTISGDAYFDGKKEAEAEDVEEKPVDELLAILRDKELYDEIVRWAATCKHPKDIRSRICTTLKGKGIKDFGYPFIKALIPHLSVYEGSKDIENLQRQLY